MMTTTKRLALVAIGGLCVASLPAMGAATVADEHPLVEFWRELHILLGLDPGDDRGVLPGCDLSLCDSLNESDCPWWDIKFPPGGNCAALADPVDQRMCRLGIYLDGDVSDALALGAVELVDQVPDNNDTPPGIVGDADQPRANGEPSGINIGHSIILYLPDSDPLDGVDDSFLYAAWDISDSTLGNTPGIPPVQYDSDDDGSACTVEDGTTGNLDLTGDVEEMLPKGYGVELQLCTDVAAYDPTVVVPNGIAFNLNAILLTTIDEVFDVPLFLASGPTALGLDVEMFPTARVSNNPPFPPLPNETVNPTNGCIDRELAFCGGDDNINTNNVELVIKRVESQPAFGFAAGADPRIVRFGLAQLLARMTAASEGDGGDEEFASMVQLTSLPAIEVSKQVRCVDAGNTAFSDSATALPGSLLEYEIAIRNTGNEDMDVTVTDVLQAVGAQGGLVKCDPLCGTLTATLTRGGVTEVITDDNAASFGLDPDFFVDSCGLPGEGFLNATSNGTSTNLGMLKGATVVRNIAGACLLSVGDEVVLHFRTRPDVTDDAAFCAERDAPDCRNAVSVTGVVAPPIAFTLDDVCEINQTCDDGLYCNGQETCSGNVCTAGIAPCPGMNCDEFADTCGFAVDPPGGLLDIATTSVRNVQDRAEVIDTPDENTNGADDNVVTIDLLCREFDFIKEVGSPGFALNTGNTDSNALRVPNVPDVGFVEIEYRYSGTNTGEVTEDITITDDYLCTDIVAAGATATACPICDSNGAITLENVAPGADYSTNCVVRFNDQSTLRAFIESDALHSDCSDPDADRYRNCATASSVPDVISLGDVCDGAAPLIAESFATIENRECVLNVIKEVRCLPDCTSSPDPGTPWVSDPDVLDVAGDACLQYRITIANASTSGVALCALRITDEMVDSNAFASGPDNISVQSPVTCPDLVDNFNWDGVPVECELSSPLGEGEQLVILFEARLASPAMLDFALDPRNFVRVEGIPEPECDGPALFFSCDDMSSIGVNTRACDLELTKDVTCDDPRAPGAVFDPELVDALPGSTVGFRIQVTNTGDVSLPRINLSDVLDCDAWFLPGTVVADIDSSDVTGCICPSGCNTIADLNGPKDFSTCGPSAVPTNGVLTITFKVKVPDDFNTPGTAVDCTNTMTVQPETDVCSDSRNNACPERTNDARINVDVPDIVCSETICADVDTDGVCDAAYLPTNGLQLACDVNDNFPLILQYEFTLSNTGEVLFASAEACKPGFVADALAAGLTVDPSCALCAGACDGVDDDCAVTGPIDTNSSAMATCELFVPDEAAWLAFAASDGGDANCHTNGVDVTGNLDTTNCCAAGADTTVTSSCEAEVCVSPPCVLDVSKEFRCITSCTNRTPVDLGTNALAALPGAAVEFVITAQNVGASGDPSICSLRFTDNLTGPFDLCPDFCTAELVTGSGTLSCTLPPGFLPIDGTIIGLDVQAACGAVMTPGDELVIRCAGTIPDTATSGDDIFNDLAVEGSLDCDPDSAVYCCEDDDTAAVEINSCGFTVEKDVTCDDPRAPGAVFDPDSVDALPGSTIGFRIRVANTGDVALPRVDLTDTLTCAAWFLAGTVVADIDGTDVTSCICPSGCNTIAHLNGMKDLTACLPGGVPPGGVLTITFKVKVPDPFTNIGTPLDCKNTIAVEGFTDICSNPLENACPVEMDTAGINVLVPDLACEKQVCADINNDGDCDDAASNGIPADVPFGGNIDMLCDVNDAYPIRLIYKFQVNNPGETPVVNAQSCDADLVANALAANLTFGPCALCTGACDGVDDDCADLGTIPPGGMAMATCAIIIPDHDAWLDFASRDQDGEVDCYSNGVVTTAEVDTTGLCAGGANTDLKATCEAQACISPPCVLDVSKEFRCIASCDDRTPVDLGTNALVAHPGAAVEFEIVARNVGTGGDPSICSLRFRDTLTGPFDPCPQFCVAEIATDSGTTTCSLSPDFLPIDGTPVAIDLLSACGAAIAPGDGFTIRCAGMVPSNATSGDLIDNQLTVEGAPECPPGSEPVYCCDADSNATVKVDTCAFEVTKQATCDDPADAGAVYLDHVDAFAASTIGFRIQVTNTGDVPLNRVQITDNLSCPTWFIPGSVMANIDGSDVTSCICPSGCSTIGDLNGLKDFSACVPPAVPTNGVLTITFKVKVPDDFAAPGTPLDCTNEVTLEPLTDVCASPTDSACGEKSDEATINVNHPSFDCDKTVAADLGNDGSIDLAATTVLTIPNQATFPIRLVYTLTLNNTGDSALPNAKICDDDLVADAVAVGVAVGPCALCVGACDGVDDTCADLGTVDAASTGLATCGIVIASQAQFEQWGALDLDDDVQSYTNEATASADVDTTGMCGAPPDLDDGGCSAQVISRQEPVPPICFPTTKANFTVWNQNEVKFTGMHRCVTFWDQTPFALYADLGIPNHFMTANLQTEKGKAQIDGIASQVCDIDADPADGPVGSDPRDILSVATPLIGVAHKLLTFSNNRQGLAGMPLVGMGKEEGYVRYDLGVPGGTERPAGVIDFTDAVRIPVTARVTARATAPVAPNSARVVPAGASRATTSHKGSLLVFPKVELRWTEVSAGIWRLTQDTFIELTNDYPGAVQVQMYFVNGDQPLDADEIPGERAHLGCNWGDVQLSLTASEPTYWSAHSGLPKGVTPLTALDPGTPPGRPATDGTNDRVLRGYVLAWAVRYVNVGGTLEQHEIVWNHLTGRVTIVNYAIGDAWEYLPWAFQAVGASHGAEPDARPGVLALDGVEYEAVPGVLLLDFYTSGSTAFGTSTVSILTETDLTLLPLLQDVRQR